jgi:hypothetical protein
MNHFRSAPLGALALTLLAGCNAPDPAPSPPPGPASGTYKVAQYAWVELYDYSEP